MQEINTWIDKVDNMDRSIMTANGLLFIDGNGIQDYLVPGLGNIFTQLMDMIAQDCMLSSIELIQELEKKSQVHIEKCLLLCWLCCCDSHLLTFASRKIFQN